MDFVLGPKLICEMFHPPATPAQAKKYNHKRSIKEVAARKAGYTLLAIEQGRFDHFKMGQQIVDHWSASTIKQAEETYRKAKMGTGNVAHCTWAKAIEAAKVRQSGSGDPATPRGPLRHEGFQQIRQTPIVVLAFKVAVPKSQVQVVPVSAAPTPTPPRPTPQPQAGLPPGLDPVDQDRHFVPPARPAPPAPDPSHNPEWGNFFDDEPPDQVLDDLEDDET